MTGDTIKRAGPPTADLDDDDAPKEYVRPGDDPVLDGALAQLKKQGGDDPLYYDVKGAETTGGGTGQTKTGPANPENRRMYVEPKTVPPTRDPTLMRMKVVVKDDVLTEEQRQRKAPTMKIQVGAGAPTAAEVLTAIDRAKAEVSVAPVPGALATLGDPTPDARATAGADTPWPGGTQAKTPIGLGPVVAVGLETPLGPPVALGSPGELSGRPVAKPIGGGSPTPVSIADAAPASVPKSTRPGGLVAASTEPGVLATSSAAPVGAASAASPASAPVEPTPLPKGGRGSTVKMATASAATAADLAESASPWSEGRAPGVLDAGALPSSYAPTSVPAPPASRAGAPSRAGLWIGLGAAAAIVLLLLWVVLRPSASDTTGAAATGAPTAPSVVAATTTAPSVAPTSASTASEGATATGPEPPTTEAPRASAPSAKPSTRPSADAKAPGTAKPIPEIF